MDESALGRLRERGERFLEEISTEFHAASAGHKPDAVLQPIYAKHREAFGDEAFDTALSLYRAAAPGSEENRSARMLLDWLIESRSGQVLAPLDEREMAWENAAVIHLPDGSVEPYQRAAITIGNTRNAAERRTLDEARAALVQAELAPMRQEKLKREHEIVAAIGVAPSYNATFEALSGISLDGLRRECEAFLRDTQSMWDDVLPERLKAGLGIGPADATRADALALMRVPEFDGAFPASDMEPAVRRQVTEMGISPDAEGRVRYDTGEREGKRARAFCAPVKIPDVVHLVLRPHGGQTDWQTLLHELGHALHFANMDRALPFEFRWLGDNSVTEGYAMLFDHRMQDAGWLARYSGLGKSDLPRFLRAAGFEELQFLRRYSAKLIYEVQLHAEGASWSSLPDLYVETLTSATGFRYQRADAFVDVDPRFYAVRYLRAWQLQSVLAESLVERFNEDWWRNPKAGPFLVGELFSHGQRESAQEQATRVSGKELSFAPLVRAIERMLT